MKMTKNRVIKPIPLGMWYRHGNEKSNSKVEAVQIKSKDLFKDIVKREGDSE